MTFAMKYKIKYINKMAKHLGKIVAKTHDFRYEELKAYISVKNIKNMIKMRGEKDQYGKYYITEDQVHLIMEDILDWLVGRDIARLAADDKIDSYWDSEKDCMIFKSK